MQVETTETLPRVVRAAGEIDLSNADRFQNALETAEKESPQGLIVDLTDTVYIDSAGIQAILFVYRQLLRRGARLVLVITNPNLKGIFALIHPEKLPGFLLSESVSSARDALTESNTDSAVP